MQAAGSSCCMLLVLAWSQTCVMLVSMFIAVLQWWLRMLHNTLSAQGLYGHRAINTTTALCSRGVQ